MYDKIHNTLASSTNLRSITAWIEFVELVTKSTLSPKLQKQRVRVMNDLAVAEQYSLASPFDKYKIASHAIQLMYGAVDHFAKVN